MPIKISGRGDIEESLKKAAEEVNAFRFGDVVEAVIVSIDKSKIWVDIGGKSLGVISGKEIPGGLEKINVGEKILAYVAIPEDEDGYAVLSLKKADRERGWRTLKKIYETKEDIEVKVVEANRGGLMVDANGTRGFLPVSQLLPENYPKVTGGDKEEILAKLKSLIGKNLKTRIITFDRAENKLIFSERATREKIIDDRFKIGDVVEGTISGVVDFGFFVNFGVSKENPQGFEGLVHISEISWGRVEKPADFAKAGDRVKAQIIGIDDGKISLSVKRLTSDPWLETIEKYKVGQIVEGEVTRLAPFGAFVRLEENVDGLVHISELSDKRILDAKEVVKEGEKYQFKIISIEPEQHRLGLSLKQLVSAPATASDLLPSSEIEKIKEISDSVRKKLEAAGIKTIAELKTKSIKDLMQIEGIGEVTAEKIVKAALSY